MRGQGPVCEFSVLLEFEITVHLGPIPFWFTHHGGGGLVHLEWLGIIILFDY